MFCDLLILKILSKLSLINQHNPAIEELQQNDDFKLIAELSHKQVKNFVIGQINEGNSIIKIYMVYQLLMILLGIFFITRSVVLALNGIFLPLLYVLGGVFFTITLLIIIHELLHGLALKSAGAPKISYGGYPAKFIFYAEADHFVMNRSQFTFVALTPFIIIKVLSLAAIMIFFNNPAVYFPVLVMTAHSLFCAGDIGLLSFFYRYPDHEVYTFDIKAAKKSYFYIREHNSG